MNMRMKLMAMVAAAGLIFTSCKKDSELDTFDADQLIAVDQNQSDNEAEEVTALEDQVMAANETIINGRMATSDTVVLPLDSSNCATVTIIPKGNNPTGKMIMDFGNGCLCKDGRTRKGKIISVFTDRLRKQGAVIETSYEGFGIIKRGSSDYLLFDNSSTKKTTTISAPANISDGAVLEIRREEDMKMTMPDGQTFTRKGGRDMKWELNQLGNRFDNVYTTYVNNFSQSGIDRKGRNYTMTVDADVVRKTACFLQGFYKPVSGQVTIQHDSKSKTVNFGTGECDDDVDVTISGKKRRMRW